MIGRTNHSTPSTTPPRLPPLPVDALDPYARATFDGVGPGGAANLVVTMAHHPRLSERFLPGDDRPGVGGALRPPPRGSPSCALRPGGAAGTSGSSTPGCHCGPASHKS